MQVNSQTTICEKLIQSLKCKNFLTQNKDNLEEELNFQIRSGRRNGESNLCKNLSDTIITILYQHNKIKLKDNIKTFARSLWILNNLKLKEGMLHQTIIHNGKRNINIKRNYNFTKIDDKD